MPFSNHLQLLSLLPALDGAWMKKYFTLSWHQLFPTPAAHSVADLSQFSRFPLDFNAEFTFPSHHFIAGSMSDPDSITETEKRQLVNALRTHRINTLTELRRVERILASIGTPDVAEPMTAAWSYYVNSHMLLTELRALTRNYPFSSECLDEAKRRVYGDPSSNRSWNFCWLVLVKIQTDQLIPYYAYYQASQPSMWGNQTPTTEGISQLTNAFIHEWTWALNQMLRHWEQPPVGGG